MSMQDEMIYKDTRDVYACHEQDGVQWLSSRKLDGLPGIRHAIATRHGGVSTGMYRSLNFSVSQGDDPQNVKQNKTAAKAYCESGIIVILTVCIQTGRMLRW